MNCVYPGRIPANTSHEARIYPLPHTYVVKDLVPDLTQFYKQYKSIKPYLQRNTKTEDVRPPYCLPPPFSLNHSKLTPLPFPLGSRKQTIPRRPQKTRRAL